MGLGLRMRYFSTYGSSEDAVVLGEIEVLFGLGDRELYKARGWDGLEGSEAH